MTHTQWNSLFGVISSLLSLRANSRIRQAHIRAEGDTFIGKLTDVIRAKGGNIDNVFLESNMLSTFSQIFEEKQLKLLRLRLFELITQLHTCSIQK